ncbi:hypothetical protein OG948_42690 (plasmid) [Embleya sp. NBC_00888]|uniref:hypothetical protein n=1 Tax=Embleya sp. NBC_00888 TaxID=2975960 RepID=UPI002F9103D4|nr:hypothetical protein OG948_42690 [Embleya sp. NBC_00888]
MSRAISMLWRHADPSLVVQLMARCDPSGRGRLAALLSDRPEVVDHALTDGDRAVHIALARYDRLPRSVLERLVALDDPEIDRHVFLNPRADTRIRRRILGRALDPELHETLRTTRTRTHALALVYARDGRLLRHALTVLGRLANRPHVERARLRAFAGLWRAEGPEAVHAALSVGRYRTKVVTPIVRAALDAPEGLMLLEVGACAGPDERELLTLLRAGGLRRGEARHVLATSDTPPDWDTLTRAHRREPFTPEVAAALAGTEGCPPSVVAVLDTAANHNHRPLEQALLAGVTTPEEFLRAGRPAWDVLRAMDTFDARSAEAAAFDPLVTALRPLLPNDVPGWLRLARTGPGFPGTVHELLRHVEHSAGTPAPAAESDRTAGPPTAPPGPLRYATSPLSLLLTHAEPGPAAEVVSALAPHDLHAFGAGRHGLAPALAVALARRWPGELPLGIARRITARRDAIQALAEVEDELSAEVVKALARTDEGVWSVDPRRGRTRYRIEGRASPADLETWPSPEPLRALPRRVPAALWRRLAEDPGADRVPDPAAAVAAYHPDCPEALLHTLVRRHPHFFSYGWVQSPAVARALIADPPVRELPTWELGDLLRDGMLTRAEILAGVRPAAHAVIACRDFARDTVRRRLRDDVDAWVVATSLLRDFPGTLEELLATAAAVTA